MIKLKLRVYFSNLQQNSILFITFIPFPARRDEFGLIKLAEDSILCEFTPWFRGLSWDSYRQYCPK